MKITRKELELIASTPKNECWVCETIINHTKGVDKHLEINEKYLKENPDIKEHLKQIIGK